MTSKSHPSVGLEASWNLIRGNTSLIDELQSQLQEHLQLPWTSFRDEHGFHVLLFSRKQVKAVQREIVFSSSGEVEISVHCKPISKAMSDTILQSCTWNNQENPKDSVGLLVLQISTVVKKIQSYEVCVGVDEICYKPLWYIEDCGEVDTNPFQELRYEETFRPFACELLVSTEGYLRRRCSICIQTKMKFTAKVKTHEQNIARPTTANVYLDKNQLLMKVNSQQKKLRNIRHQLYKLRSDLQKLKSKAGLHINDTLSDELLNICMSYVNVITQ